MPASTIIAAPSSLSYSGAASPQTVNVTMSDASGEAVFVASDQTWLHVSTGLVITPSSFIASIDLTGLANGTYTGHITLTPSCCTSSPSGAISSSIVAHGGASYVNGEAFTVAPNALSTCPCSVAAGIIDTVNGSGAVTAYHLTYGGDCYAVTPVQDTLVVGPGDGTFTINITGITNGVGGCETPTVIPVTLLVGPAITTGNIVVQKFTNPGGSPQSFVFTTDYGSPFSLTDTETSTSAAIAAGIYTVTETLVPGWTTTSSITYGYGQGPYGGPPGYGGGTVTAVGLVSPPVFVGTSDTITVTFINTQVTVPACGEVLTKVDTWELDNGQPDWASNDTTPIAWYDNNLGQQKVGITRPNVNGTIGLLYVQLAAALTGAGVAMTIPDDWTPYVLWGALADLLNHDGPAYDPVRGKYCQQRYEEGVELARIVLKGA